MHRNILKNIVGLVLVPVVVGAAWAVLEGLTLNKDQIIIRNAVVGGETGIDLPDVCVNPEKHISCFLTLKNAARRGYDKLPATVLASLKHVNILIMPDGPKYYNRHFEAALTARAEGPIVTEVSIPVWIETENKIFNSVGYLKNGFGFMPIALDVPNMTKNELFMYNNTGSSRTFNISLLHLPQRSGSNLFVQSPGYEWLKNGSVLEINVKTGKKLARNSFLIELPNMQRAEIEVSGVESVPHGQEVLIVAVPTDSAGFEFARVFRPLKGDIQ